jgi:hypothetical protein
MIASDRDGAITRTDEPERSFDGTTGTGPSWPIPAGPATALPVPSPAADEMLVAERDLDVARDLTETAGNAEYSTYPSASTHPLTPACPMCSASSTTSSSSGSALPDDRRRHPTSTTNGAPRDHRRHLLIVRDRTPTACR